MSFTITTNWIIDLLITGLAVSIAAFFLPFVYVKNYGTAILVGLLITVANAVIWALLGAIDVNLVGTSALAKGIIDFLIYTVAILVVDAILSNFRVSGFIMAALFGVIVAVLTSVLTQFFGALL